MQIKKINVQNNLLLPLYSSRVSAGFPSPAESYVEEKIDLNKHIIKHPAATFFAKANGNSMTQRGIFDGDLLVIDRSIKPKHNSIVIAAINGDMVCKTIDLKQKILLSANKHYPPIQINEETNCLIEGVVTHSLRYHNVCSG